jgi:5'-phosphate synthase pdxT subunit
MRRYGVLALQGAFIEHAQMLHSLGVEAVEVRLPEQLQGLNGLIIPGGESTTIGKLAVTYGLVDPIRRMAQAGMPLWGTCAGMILLAKNVGKAPLSFAAKDQPLIGVMDIAVQRNAFGRQVDSFEVDVSIPALDAVSVGEERGRPFRAVFIRAPCIQSTGKGVEALASLPDGPIVAARQGNLLVTAFHPELSGDTRFHRFFLTLAGPRSS